MQLQTILNHVEWYKSFVYESVRWSDTESKVSLEVEVRPRANSRPIFSGCGQRGPGYDRLPSRRFDFVPLWGIAVYFLYAMRRVDCQSCGVTVEPGSLVRREESLDDNLSVVPGLLGQEVVVERDCGGLWDDVAERIPLGKTRRILGSGAPRAGRDRVDRRRRSAVPEGAQVPDAGLPDRRRLEVALVDRPGPDGQDVFAILPDAGQRTFGPAEVYLQRHVETVSEGNRQEGRPGDSCARSVSHHAEVGQGDRRSSGRRGETNEGRRLRGGPQALAVVPIETAGEHDRQTDGEVVGVVDVQPPQRASLSAQGRLSVILGIRQPWLGGRIPRPMVHTNDAFQARTNEEGRPYLTQPSGTDPQLVSSERRDLCRNRRRIKQQSETDHEKIVRFPHLRCC